MRYELMTYSDVMRQWERRSVRNKHYYFDRGVLPKDKTWHVIAMLGAIVLGCCVLSVRWWLCV